VNSNIVFGHFDFLNMTTHTPRNDGNMPKNGIPPAAFASTPKQKSKLQIQTTHTASPIRVMVTDPDQKTRDWLHRPDHTLANAIYVESKIWMKRLNILWIIISLMNIAFAISNAIIPNRYLLLLLFMWTGATVIGFVYLASMYTMQRHITELVCEYCAMIQQALDRPRASMSSDSSHGTDIPVVPPLNL
jgi:hypothetical protein